MMENKKKWMRIGSTIVFLAALFLVEAGPWGSISVARYNGGYGTFDMKFYNPAAVYGVLSGCTEQAIGIMKKYYFLDYLFITAFLIFQVMLSTLVFRKINSKVPKRLLNSIAVLRAIADCVENALLLYVINAYPIVHPLAVETAYGWTRVKFQMVPVWGILLMVGVIFNFISMDKNISKCIK